MSYKLLVLFALTLIFGCKNAETKQTKKFTAGDSSYVYSGRIEKMGDSAVALINSAAAVKALVKGDSCIIDIQSGADAHLYAAVELNGKYLGRYKIDSIPLKFDLVDSMENNALAIYKITEASNGPIFFKGITAENISKPTEENKPKIEFIGNSITCGMGAEIKDIPCGEGEWYDQHNAYLAYGPRVARALNTDFELNCVSGMGMYRNWNDEDMPVMPDVYENLYLNIDSIKKADFKDVPDIVSIALGTNDLSLGDGEKERSSFSKEKFTQNYIGFVEGIFKRYPDTKIVLLTSPMIGGENNMTLLECLKDVQTHFNEKNISIFEFEAMTAHGCTGHPDVDDHQKMADQLIPFFKKLMTK
ncbi:GDSL-type esterase/lipase family protein [Gillisia sp. M10.2A]|uniref:GDSL-type esterase/lipase family protein n=1 Tax=Gillisia lutea TaxID=2909668 RepID=A0ABS9EEG7_9FLAO|nr:SGNH/GDSL hydrolase family protein [Gillisia lutea]MCF4101188.1 GDSL-type esterase/lipase family protein [Gillisia lutea]